MPSFAAQPQDENLVYGWNNQGAFATGTAPAGYASVQDNYGAAQVTTGQTGSGLPTPVVPGNADTSPALENPGYAGTNPACMSPGPLAASFVPVPATTVAFPSPSGLAATVVITGGTMTNVSVAPAVTTPGGSPVYATVGAGAGTYTVPGGGYIKMTFSAAPTWAWTLNI